MLISVIVPIYNVEEYLHRCVDSILNQTFTDFELILVDDGSTDNCGNICDEYAKKDSRVIVIHKQNGGLSDARNAGIDWAFKNSNSEWITFIDSDDWVHCEYLMQLINAAQKYNVDISVCNHLDIDKYVKDCPLEVKTEYMDIEEFYSKKSIAAWGKLYKKYLFENVRYPYGKVHEDTFTTHKLLFQNSNIVYVDNVLYYYYQRENSIVNAKWTSKRLDILEAYDEVEQFFINNKFPNALMQSYLSACWYMDFIINKELKNDKKYKKDIRKIRIKMKQFLIKYRKLSKEPISKLSHYWETACPNFMKMYWLACAMLNKIKSKKVTED